MAHEARENNLLDSACDLLEAAIELAEHEVREDLDFSWLYNYKPMLKELKTLYDTAKKVIKFIIIIFVRKSRLYELYIEPNS